MKFGKRGAAALAAGALLAGALTTGTAWAGPGPAPAGSAPCHDYDNDTLRVISDKAVMNEDPYAASPNVKTLYYGDVVVYQAQKRNAHGNLWFAVMDVSQQYDVCGWVYPRHLVWD